MANTKKKKDGRTVNCVISKETYEGLEEICQKFRQSKTAAVELAIQLYVEKMRKVEL